MAEIDADKLLNEKDEMYIQKMLQYQVPQAAVRRKFTQTTAFLHNCKLALLYCSQNSELF